MSFADNFEFLSKIKVFFTCLGPRGKKLRLNTAREQGFNKAERHRRQVDIFEKESIDRRCRSSVVYL